MVGRKRPGHSLNPDGQYAVGIVAPDAVDDEALKPH
jgi:hypothetical protein